ncbi:hypothetical protein SKAU_G00177740 [Synaphobranchus kaupii]|uniref:Uncharacterized protein n=1 Tax=Synaphobranchus kaupii TaxID=118154 RepID=A0A9Q1FLP7_SYNKA|nr:hypothetical protein SKAU_G00177740 [Synaphobranchus kaupii]
MTNFRAQRPGGRMRRGGGGRRIPAAALLVASPRSGRLTASDPVLLRRAGAGELNVNERAGRAGLAEYGLAVSVEMAFSETARVGARTRGTSSSRGQLSPERSCSHFANRASEIPDALGTDAPHESRSWNEERGNPGNGLLLRACLRVELTSV